MRESKINEWFLRLSHEEKKELYKASKQIDRLKTGYNVLMEYHKKITKEITRANYELSKELGKIKK